MAADGCRGRLQWDAVLPVADARIGPWGDRVAKSGSQRNQRALDKFLAPLEVSAFDESAMREYGKLRSALEAKGRAIGPLDQLIAAHALALGATLASNNLRAFERVEGLKLENWIDP
jgi:tRNA(fMet)-specific endonuclease VapC